MKFKSWDYKMTFNLFGQQEWLIDKEEELKELLTFCETKENKKLVISLLERFVYLKQNFLHRLLNEISDYIINNSGFQEEETQILSLTYDDEPDSSQKILDLIKITLFKSGWRKVKCVNSFGKGIRNFNKGKDKMILIDEFIGSGKTLSSRLNYLDKNISGEYEVLCCFVAGIEDAIEDLSDQVPIFCPLQMKKGISGYYENNELKDANDIMNILETKLAPEINGIELSDYKFGYGQAEALYSLEGCLGNTPNSVFPIFWWSKDNVENNRNTLLTRYQKGF